MAASLAVADYDDGTPIYMIREVWDKYEHVLYSSHSHTAAHNKCRVVLPLAEPILTGNWRSVWLHFRDMADDAYEEVLAVDATPVRGKGRIDRSCKDPSRHRSCGPN